MTPRIRLAVAFVTATFISATAATAATGQGKVAPSPSKRVVQVGSTKVQFGTKLTNKVQFQHTLQNGQIVSVDSGTEIAGLIVRTQKGVKDPKRVEIRP